MPPAALRHVAGVALLVLLLSQAARAACTTGDVRVDCGASCCPAGTPDCSAHLCGDGYPCLSDIDCASVTCRRSVVSGGRYCAGLAPSGGLTSRLTFGLQLRGNATMRTLNESSVIAALALLSGLDTAQLALQQLDDVPGGGVDARLAAHVLPSEALLAIDRLSGAINGSLRVLRGGWAWEDALARTRGLVEAEAGYCRAFFDPCDMRATAFFFAAFGPPCARLVPRVAAACGIEGSITDTATASSAPTPHSPPPSVSPSPSSGGGPVYTLGLDVAALGRVGLVDALGAAGAVTGVTVLEAPSVDGFGAPPSLLLTPVGLRVLVEPRGTPAAPLWPGRPFALQPFVALLDAHGRTASAADQELRVIASLELAADAQPGERARVVLTGALVVRGAQGAGGVAFLDLGVSGVPNATNGIPAAMRLRFTCTLRASVGVGLIQLTGVSRDFVVVPATVPEVVPVIRQPFNAWAAGTLFFVALVALLSAAIGVLGALRARRTPARIVDAALTAAGSVGAPGAIKASGLRNADAAILAWVRVATGEGDISDSDSPAPPPIVGGVVAPRQDMAPMRVTGSGAAGGARRRGVGPSPDEPGIPSVAAGAQHPPPGFAAAVRATMGSLAHVEGGSPSAPSLRLEMPAVVGAGMRWPRVSRRVASATDARPP